MVSLGSLLIPPNSATKHTNTELLIGDVFRGTVWRNRQPSNLPRKYHFLKNKQELFIEGKQMQ